LVIGFGIEMRSEAVCIFNQEWGGASAPKFVTQGTSAGGREHEGERSLFQLVQPEPVMRADALKRT
jgi:hypothetical protein